MRKKIEDLIKEISGESGVKITRPQESFGDYTTNIAFQKAKKEKRNPDDVAREIAKKIELDEIEKIEVIKGFINIFLKKETYQNNLINVLKENYGSNNIGLGKKINVEYVSANPTGPLHIASARAAAFGDTLVRLLRYLGYSADSEYYVDDGGQQVELLKDSVIARIKEIKGEIFQFPEGGYLGEYIKDIAKEVIDKKIEDIKNFSINYIMNMQKKTLERYRTNFENFVSEKWIRDSGRIEEFLKRLESKGKLFRKDGAVLYKGERDRVFVKSDGSYTYIVPDIAYHIYKYERGYDHLIDLLGPDHIAHVPDLKLALQDLGFEDKLEVIIVQWVHLLKDGILLKMSKRAGSFITMDELIDEVGVDPARFFFLMRDASTPMDFDINLAKEQSDRNPVYYVQYSHARICSLLDFAEKKGYKEIETEKVNLLNDDEEIKILRELYFYPEFLQDVLENRTLHLLTSFLINLSSYYHNFYQKRRIIGGEEEKVIPRLILSKAFKNVVKITLELMGVNAPERM